jgi:hypothetical protein
MGGRAPAVEREVCRIATTPPVELSADAIAEAIPTL